MRISIIILVFIWIVLSDLTVYAQSSQFYAKVDLSEFDLVGNPFHVSITEKRIYKGAFKTKSRDTTLLTFTNFGKLEKIDSPNHLKSYAYNNKYQLTEVFHHFSDSSIRYADSLAYTDFDSIQTIFVKRGKSVFKLEKDNTSENYEPFKGFTYDSLNRLISILPLRESDTAYRRQITSWKAGMIEQSSEYPFDTYKSSCNRQFLDSAGNIVRIEYMDTEFGHYLTEFRKYNSNGQLLNQTYEDDWALSLWKEDSPKIGIISRLKGHEKEYRYDSLGRVTYASIGDKKHKDIRTYTFNTAGKLTREEHRYWHSNLEHEALALIKEYRYDDLGRLESVHYSDSGSKWKETFKYDARNNWVKRKSGRNITRRSITYHP